VEFISEDLHSSSVPQIVDDLGRAYEQDCGTQKSSDSSIFALSIFALSIFALPIFALPTFAWRVVVRTERGRNASKGAGLPGTRRTGSGNRNSAVGGRV
jgi:hypothetical protein